MAAGSSRRSFAGRCTTQLSSRSRTAPGFLLGSGFTATPSCPPRLRLRHGPCSAPAPSPGLGFAATAPRAAERCRRARLLKQFPVPAGPPCISPAECGTCAGGWVAPGQGWSGLGFGQDIRTGAAAENALLLLGTSVQLDAGGSIGLGSCLNPTLPPGSAAPASAKAAEAVAANGDASSSDPAPRTAARVAAAGPDDEGASEAAAAATAARAKGPTKPAEAGAENTLTGNSGGADDPAASPPVLRTPRELRPIQLHSSSEDSQTALARIIALYRRCACLPFSNTYGWRAWMTC